MTKYPQQRGSHQAHLGNGLTESSGVYVCVWGGGRVTELNQVSEWEGSLESKPVALEGHGSNQVLWLEVSLYQIKLFESHGSNHILWWEGS